MTGVESKAELASKLETEPGQGTDYTLVLRVNGKVERIPCNPGDSLCDVLRAAGHTEVKKACGTGNCGLCTVLLDGVPVPSCSVLAGRADSREVTTIKGVEKEAREFAGFLIAEGADQCGFCSPGFTLMVLTMKKELVSPTELEIRHYLAGNLCRCSGYVGQLRAIKKYLEASNA
jgi:aerobic carbon-monoxide dehydrogenase small subunit